MTCRDVEARLGAYLDGELDAAESAAVAAHLKACPACSRSFERQRALRAALRAEVPALGAPDTLRIRVRDAVRRAAPAVSRRRLPAWSWLAVAAVLVLAVAETWKATSDRAAQNVLVEEVLAAHLRSLMPGHLTDVLSSDQHTVKPWFDGRLDFSPPVTDEAAAGYPLVGGRLDYVRDRPVAALVYARRLHHINVFVWPNRDGRIGGALLYARNGYYLYRWSQGRMVFWAVSDLNWTELEGFVRLLQQAGATGAAP